MEVPGDAQAGATEARAEPEGDEADFRPKRSPLLLVILLLVILVGAGGAAFALLRETREPLRVLVAVEADGLWWEGSTTSARLLDNVVPHLKKLGFEPIDGGDVEVVKKLQGAATAEDAAKRVGASFIVTGPLKVEVTDLGKDVGMIEVRASGAIRLAHFSGTPKEIGNVRTWSGAPEKAEALKLASESLGKQTFDVLLPGLLAHDAVQAIVKGSDTIAAGKLSAAKVYVEKRDSQLAFAKTSYAELRQKLLASDHSPNKLTLHGPFDREEGLCGTGAGGFFAKQSSIRPFYSPVDERLRYFHELESLYWQGADGKPRSVFEGYNVFGYASASPDGATAVYVQDLYGSGTALEVVRGTEPAKRVFMDPKLQLSDPKVAAGGTLVAARARECSRCPAAVIVIDAKSGKVLHRSDPKQGTLGGFVWLGATRLGVLLRAPEVQGRAAPAEDEEEEEEADETLPSQEFYALDFNVEPAARTTLGSVSGAARLSLPSASASGKRVVFSRYAEDGMHLLLYEEEGGKLEPLDVANAREPVLSPAGDKIAFMRHNQIELYDLTTKIAQPLTKVSGDFSLRYPQFALDGRRVYFEIRGQDPVFPKERALSVVASVPVP